MQVFQALRINQRLVLENNVARSDLFICADVRNQDVGVVPQEDQADGQTEIFFIDIRWLNEPSEIESEEHDTIWIEQF